ncbi:hypothetical protein D3C85_1723910 [compost metagenome]
MASGNAFEIKTKKVRNIIPDPTMIPMYFIGYFPMKTNINIIEKINAVVEKFEGRININVIKTGSQSSFNDSKKSIGSVRVLDK